MTDSTCYPEPREGDCAPGEPLTAKVPARERAAARGALALPGAAGRWRAGNLIWLIYSVFFIIDPLQQGSRRAWLIFGAVYACFLAIYLPLVFSSSDRTRKLLLLALAILGAACYPVNASAGASLFIYVAAFIPFATTSFALAAGTIAAAALVSAAEGLLLHLSPWACGGLAFLAASVGAGNLISALRLSATRRLLHAQEQIEQLATVAERERIARDLHDVLGHTLSVVVLKSELAGKLIGTDAPRARCEIGEVEQIARKALGEVREAIRGYRSEGITAEIARARRTLDAAGVTLQWQPRSLRVEPAHEPVLSLVLREAVTNILRHARATSCRLELTADAHGTRLTIEDDGQGAGEYSGNGVRGMRERIEALGGQLRIEGDRGTRLTADIPAPAAS